MIKNVKLAYIGGGSRAWARKFMTDLAIQDDFCGSVNLYDIDEDAAKANVTVSEIINKSPKAISKFSYTVSKTLKEALTGVQFVIISILPGTFDEMESDVHVPEKYGVYHSVGDTAGPGGVVRAMRTIPMFEVIAKAVEECCPDAWVINFTNPMTWCIGTLYKTFPKIKAFGCCHEVFGTQDFLAKDVLKETLGVTANRQDIKTDVVGVNHFTWITKATYNGQDIFPLYKEYCKKHAKDYYPFDAEDCGDLLKAVQARLFENKNLVKMDLFERYGQIAAAGDRHLAEFVNKNWYLRNPKTIAKFGFGLTPVKWRKNDLVERINKTKDIIEGKETLTFSESGEEFTIAIRALLGIGGDFLTNVNIPNVGQVKFAPKGAIVETNAIFSKDSLKPVDSEPLNPCVENLVSGIIERQELTLNAIMDRNLQDTLLALTVDPLCADLNFEEVAKMFNEMVDNTKQYLGDWNLN